MTPTETAAILRKFAQCLRADKYLWGASLPGVSAEVGAAIESAVEMIGRLEAAEKDNALKEKLIDRLALELNWTSLKHDALRTKIEEMEQQKPVAYLPLSSAHMLESSAIANGVVWNCRDKAASDMPLYALPGAHPATSETGAKP